MPDFLKVRLITRDVSNWPHRDLENTELRTDVEVWWGTKPVPKGYVTIFDLGYQKMDFDGGIDLTHHSVGSADRSHDASELSPNALRALRKTSRRDGRRKTTRKKVTAKRGVGRPRGSGKKV